MPRIRPLKRKSPFPELSLPPCHLTLHSRHILSLAQNRTAAYEDFAVWPAVPFDISIPNQPNGRIRFFRTYRQGTPSQNAEAQRLVAGEVHYLESHGGTIGPKDINVDADFTTIWLGCHAWIEPRTRWTNTVAIDTLKALQGYLEVNGFWESDFDVTALNYWLATCQLRLHAPSPGPVSGTDIL